MLQDNEIVDAMHIIMNAPSLDLPLISLQSKIHAFV